MAKHHHSNSNHGSTSRDLILVTSHRDDFDRLAPLVLSLKRAGFCGSTVIFVSCMDAESVEKLRNHGVRVVPFHFADEHDFQRRARWWPLWRWFFSTRASVSQKNWLAHRVFHLRYLRYLLYEDFLQQRTVDFDRIMLADGRDVFFQADPFAWDWTPGVHFFLEDARQRIGTCRWHRQWLGYQFDASFIEQNATRIPSCSGTTFGDTAGIRRYLEAMITTTMRARDLAKISSGDQGIHNYIMIQNLLKDMVIHENRRGPVLTMGAMSETDCKMDASGAALNENGEVVPVLHQYDRVPSLKERFSRVCESSLSSVPND